MPARTNPFQKLILAIESQLAPAGASIVESAEILDMDADELREVDILIEVEVGLRTLRIAVECRDRGRPDDVTWVDDTIGKYARMQVDKIVLVSNSGFSKTALKKAQRFGIDTLTLAEANVCSWPDVLKKSYIQCLSFDSTLVNVRCRYKNPKLDLDTCRIVDIGGTSLGSPQDVALTLFDEAKMVVQTKFRGMAMADLFADGQSEQIHDNLVRFPAYNLMLVDANNDTRKLDSAALLIRTTVRLIETDTKYFEYESARVLVGSAITHEGKEIVGVKAFGAGEEVSALTEFDSDPIELNGC